MVVVVVAWAYVSNGEREWWRASILLLIETIVMVEFEFIVVSR